MIKVMCIWYAADYSVADLQSAELSGHLGMHPHSPRMPSCQSRQTGIYWASRQTPGPAEQRKFPEKERADWLSTESHKHQASPININCGKMGTGNRCSNGASSDYNEVINRRAIPCYVYVRCCAALHFFPSLFSE